MALLKILASRKLRFGECPSEVHVDTHHLSRGLHFRSQNGIDTGKAVEGESRFLHGGMGEVQVPGNPQQSESLATHDFRGDFGPWDAGSLADKGDGARRTWIHLEDIDGITPDRILDIDQSHHIQLFGQIF